MNEITKILNRCDQLRTELKLAPGDQAAILKVASLVNEQSRQASSPQMKSFCEDVRSWLLVAEQSGHSATWANAWEKIQARAPQIEEA